MKDTSLYEKNKNPDQESLVLNNLNLVKRIALHLKARLPSHVELDELMQVGMIGLIEASKSFKFDKGIQFENYAHARVRGSMIDEIRKMSSQPRSSLTLKKTYQKRLFNFKVSWVGNPLNRNLPNTLVFQFPNYKKI